MAEVDIQDQTKALRDTLLMVADALGIHERESLKLGELFLAICDEARRLKTLTQAPQPWRDR